YHYSNYGMSWNQAEAWCKQYYTNMVAIQNHEEIAHLNNILPKVHGHYWIGIRKTNGTWTWVGTNKPLTATAENWAEREPNNVGQEQDCVEIYIKRDKDAGKWNDEACAKIKTALCYTASCQDDSCGPHGECVETINNHSCKCFEGFFGEKCEHVLQCKAEEISVPQSGSVNCFHPNGQFAYDSQCRYSCSEGYQIAGSPTTQCKASKTWSNPAPTCEVVQCSELTAPAQGTMRCENPLGHFSYQSSCGFTCEEGYTLRGSRELVCSATGHWNNSVPTCEGKGRSRVDTLKVHCTLSASDLTVNSTCHFNCDTGFDLQGAVSTKCTETGEWSTEVPSCTAVMCPYLQEPINGFIDCSSENNTFSTICSFGCFDGYRLHGYKEVTCNLTGNWSGEEPECQGKTVKPQIRPDIKPHMRPQIRFQIRPDIKPHMRPQIRFQIRPDMPLSQNMNCSVEVACAPMYSSGPDGTPEDQLMPGSWGLGSLMPRPGLLDHEETQAER
uniref:E-selectin n=1 Tax=Electrophorus electricus TaxID=8005 RepID=A0A4W4FK31_ELEEL